MDAPVSRPRVIGLTLARSQAGIRVVKNPDWREVAAHARLHCRLTATGEPAAAME